MSCRKQLAARCSTNHEHPANLICLPVVKAVDAEDSVSTTASVPVNVNVSDTQRRETFETTVPKRLSDRNELLIRLLQLMPVPRRSRLGLAFRFDPLFCTEHLVQMQSFRTSLLQSWCSGGTSISRLRDKECSQRITNTSQ
jgi:hypothetical protein